MTTAGLMRARVRASAAIRASTPPGQAPCELLLEGSAREGRSLRAEGESNLCVVVEVRPGAGEGFPPVDAPVPPYAVHQLTVAPAGGPEEQSIVGAVGIEPAR